LSPEAELMHEWLVSSSLADGPTRSGSSLRLTVKESLIPGGEGTTMGKVSKESATQAMTSEGFEGHYEDISGYTVGFESYDAHIDMAPLFEGLPNDMCQCTHMGVVLKGSLKYHYADGSEDLIGAGEAYVARPGHTPELFPDTEVIEFSPSAELAKTIEVVSANMAKAGP
jgi:hypothetical protein